jgi:hypothetical protein
VNVVISDVEHDVATFCPDTTASVDNNSTATATATLITITWPLEQRKQW